MHDQWTTNLLAKGEYERLLDSGLIGDLPINQVLSTYLSTSAKIQHFLEKCESMPRSSSRFFINPY